jgi:hypothetical protein
MMRNITYYTKLATKVRIFFRIYSAYGACGSAEIIGIMNRGKFQVVFQEAHYETG